MGNPRLGTCPNHLTLPLLRYDEIAADITIRKDIVIKKNDKDKNFHSQSLRTTSLAHVHEEGLPEQTMKEFSGHRRNAIRTYKVTPNVIHS